MTQIKRENNSFLSTVYLLILFLAGIIVGATYQHNDLHKRNLKVLSSAKAAVQFKQTKKETKPQVKEQVKEQSSEKQTEPKETLKPDQSSVNPTVQKLENELITVLVTKGIIQQDIVKQYAKEIEDGNSEYTQYYKEITIAKNRRIDVFDYQFKTLARNCNIEVSKVSDDNAETVAYSFYDKNKVYSIVVFKKSDDK